MPGQTFETKIAYRLDPRGLREARRELERTFKPTSSRELNSALKEMRGMIKALTSEQVRLTTAMLGMRKGTDEYKRLEETLEGVEERMRSIGRAAAAAAQAVRDAGHGAFAQGFLQGISPLAGGFLERGPGMRRQFLGQMVGGAIRGGALRAMGAASAMMGGAGPFSTLFGGVPFIGGAAQLAEQSAGMAIDFQRARLAAMPFMGLTPEGLAAAARAGERRALRVGEGRIAAAALKAAEAEFGVGAQQEKALEGDVRGMMERGMIPRSFIRENPELVKRGTIEEVWGSLPLGAREDYIRRSIEETRAARTEATGVRAGRAYEAAEAAEAARIRTEGRAAGLRAPFQPYLEAGGAALYSRLETMQALAEFGQQVGRLPGVAAFRSALGLERLYGVDRGVSAQLLRQLRPGRGGITTLGEDLLPALVADAIAEGLEGSEITEHLAHIAELQEQAASRGMKIQSETLSEMALGLGKALGLEGLRGGQVVAQLAGAAQNVVTQGVQGPVGIQLLRAAGFRPELGRQSFFAARRRLARIAEGGFDADMMFDFMRNLIAGTGDEEAAGYTLERALGAAGVTIGPEEAIRMVRGLAGGRETFAAALEQARKTGGIRTAEDVSRALGAPEFKALTETIRAQNAIQDKLLSAGSDIVGNVQKLQLQAASLADKMGDLSPHMEKAVNGIVTLSKGVEILIDKINQYLSTFSPEQPRHP